jgi:hypothetical protein
MERLQNKTNEKTNRREGINGVEENQLDEEGKGEEKMEENEDENERIKWG